MNLAPEYQILFLVFFCFSIIVSGSLIIIFSKRSKPSSLLRFFLSNFFFAFGLSIAISKCPSNYGIGLAFVTFLVYSVSHLKKAPFLYRLPLVFGSLFACGYLHFYQFKTIQNYPQFGNGHYMSCTDEISSVKERKIRNVLFLLKHFKYELKTPGFAYDLLGGSIEKYEISKDEIVLRLPTYEELWHTKFTGLYSVTRVDKLCMWLSKDKEISGLWKDCPQDFSE